MDLGWVAICIIGEGCSRAWNACGGCVPLHPVLWFWLILCKASLMPMRFCVCRIDQTCLSQIFRFI